MARWNSKEAGFGELKGLFKGKALARPAETLSGRASVWYVLASVLPVHPNYGKQPYVLGRNNGYRPGRSAQQAIRKVKEYVEQGYITVVEIDLSKYFDRFNHEMLMNVVREEASRTSVSLSSSRSTSSVSSLTVPSNKPSMIRDKRRSATAASYARVLLFCTLD